MRWKNYSFFIGIIAISAFAHFLVLLNTIGLVLDYPTKANWLHAIPAFIIILASLGIVISLTIYAMIKTSG